MNEPTTPSDAPTEGSAVEWLMQQIESIKQPGNVLVYLPIKEAIELARRADEAEAQVKRYDSYHSSLIVEAEQLRGQLADEWDNARQCREEIEALKGDVAAMAANQGEWMRRAMAFEDKLAAVQAEALELREALIAMREYYKEHMITGKLHKQVEAALAKKEVER